jgi:hypothetical protein
MEKLGSTGGGIKRAYQRPPVTYTYTSSSTKHMKDTGNPLMSNYNPSPNPVPKPVSRPQNMPSKSVEKKIIRRVGTLGAQPTPTEEFQVANVQKNNKFQELEDENRK